MSSGGSAFAGSGVCWDEAQLATHRKRVDSALAVDAASASKTTARIARWNLFTI